MYLAPQTQFSPLTRRLGGTAIPADIKEAGTRSVDPNADGVWLPVA